MRLISILAAMLVMLPSATGIAHAQTAGDPPVFPIADVIAEVKRELAVAENAPGAKLGLTLQSVALEFSLARSTDASGEATVGIPVLGGVKIGGSGGQKGEEMSSLVVELAPPKGTGTMSADKLDDLGIAKAIIETRSELLKGLEDQPKLAPKKVVITLKFVVTRTGGGKGEISFLVFTVEGGVTLTSENANSIALTFVESDQP
jgi:hypothetical protein